MPSVRVVRTSCVSLPLGVHPPAGDTVPLSLFDTLWTFLPPVQRLFLYPDPPAASGAPFLESLKSSLALTLPNFLPFAGKLIHRPASGDVVIDCSASEGVAFLEAESDLDIDHLAGDEDHDVRSFLQLVPDISVKTLPAPASAVQVTTFTGGGYAIGIAVNHMVADGRGLWLYIEAWATACRSGGPPAGPPPVHSRAVIQVSGGEDMPRVILRQAAPDLPKVMSVAEMVSIEDRLRLLRKSFEVSKDSIHALKRLAAGDGTAPSTFVVLSAHAWVCATLARGFTDEEPTFLRFLADCRAYLNPPIDGAYTGNCVAVCFVEAMSAAELAAPGGFARACKKIEKAVAGMKREPLRGCEVWLEKSIALPQARLVGVVASPRFRAYDVADFGWGRPGRTELVSMNGDGEVALVGGKEEGAVHVSVALPEPPMLAFARLFLSGIS